MSAHTIHLRAGASRVIGVVAVWAVGLAIGLACDRNTEPFVEGEEPRSPNLSRIFPDTDPSAERALAATEPTSASPPGRGAPRGMGGGQGAGTTRASAPQAGASIRGTISIASELVAPPGAVLFLIARPSGVTAGPPLAVLREPAATFPFAFEIGPANVMIPTMRFEGDISLTARLDSDGNAMTRLPGDLEAPPSGPLRPGAVDVEIELGRKL